MNEILDIARMQLKSVGFVDVYKIQSMTKSSLDYIREVLSNNNIEYRFEKFG
jgi:hypothetical protein